MIEFEEEIYKMLKDKHKKINKIYFNNPKPVKMSNGLIAEIRFITLREKSLTVRYFDNVSIFMREIKLEKCDEKIKEFLYETIPLMKI